MVPFLFCQTKTAAPVIVYLISISIAINILPCYNSINTQQLIQDIKSFIIDSFAFDKELKMSEFTVNEMQEMQKMLQEKYKDKWEPICKESGKNKLLWMIGEIGEVIDIIKKNGDKKASEDEELRKNLIEEMADVLMYYNDVMLCYGITSDELKKAYTEKFEKNMKRW